MGYSRRDPTLLLLIAAVVIVVFALVSRVASDASAVPTVAAMTAAPSPTPVAIEAPTATPSPSPTGTPTYTPDPTASESPEPTAIPTASPTPTPTPRPTIATASPTAAPIVIANASGPIPSGSTRYQGTVTDGATGAPLAGVCVYAGPPAGCPSPSLLTDAAGRFAVDFPAGLGFTFTFEKDGYVPALRQTGTTMNVALVRR
ncbi:MAG: hypothetical protein NVS9B6_09620 [Candidatus Limnocylindrales bacterium]